MVKGFNCREIVNIVYREYISRQMAIDYLILGVTIAVVGGIISKVIYEGIQIRKLRKLGVYH
jgi:hypothetical protein